MKEETVKVKIENYDKNTNSIELILNNEGHTAASVITERLEQNATFSAYKISHPTDKFVRIKVEAKEDPVLLIKNCIGTIIKDLEDVIETLKE
ncbi:hypothetical protein NUSPORA_02702 [Nucleospora cyclopteri]